MVRPSAPSVSSSSSAAPRISRARGESSPALETVTRAEAVTDRAVERDVRSPGQAGDEPADREAEQRGENEHRERAEEGVHDVVNRHRPRVELLRGEGEDRQLPREAVPGGLEDRRGEEERGQGRVREAERGTDGDRVHGFLSLANGVSLSEQC